MPTDRDPHVLLRLRALIAEALALSDAQHLHPTGIALDTARLSVEDALTQARARAFTRSTRRDATRFPHG